MTGCCPSEFLSVHLLSLLLMHIKENPEIAPETALHVTTFTVMLLRLPDRHVFSLLVLICNYMQPTLCTPKSLIHVPAFPALLGMEQLNGSPYFGSTRVVGRGELRIHVMPLQHFLSILVMNQDYPNTLKSGLFPTQNIFGVEASLPTLYGSHVSTIGLANNCAWQLHIGVLLPVLLKGRSSIHHAGRPCSVVTLWTSSFKVGYAPTCSEAFFVCQMQKKNHVFGEHSRLISSVTFIGELMARRIHNVSTTYIKGTM
ncbi:uncharacterized protein EV420DRAFT_1483413 [Desarmillaria tabescens]|uniref:Uncharacterized protein n=1 Tax=Armillaria tabescens TaxID=1929756 RepID=A0AA39MWH2_ARMTA|nr:uncharacterized protein EV420DRAFT_1483413 [Desarmillaria tabescens]KAK0448400.1 hypothetical protein EV420DRAFT_1483413 [Desarmillaria tabescens]